MENPFRNHQQGDYRKQFQIPVHSSNRSFVQRPQYQGPKGASTAPVCYSLINGAQQCNDGHRS